MVTEWLMQALAVVVRGFFALLPPIPVPGWLDASGWIGTIFGSSAAMSSWLPWPLLVTVGTACVASWLLGFGIKVVRIVASFLTLGGGSAA